MISPSIFDKNLAMHSTDHETGEMVLAIRPTQMNSHDIDMETGEFDANITTLPMRKTRFVIPKELIQPQKDRRSKRCCIDSNENYTLFKKEEVMTLQEVFML